MNIILVLLFFLSGFGGLVLETIWFRKLALIFGSTSWSAGTIGAAFLGGIGFGGLLASFVADRIRRRVFVYALLELFIGVYALLSPSLIDLLDHWQASMLGGAALSPSLYAMIRFAVIFMVLLPPTLAMGMTLPLLARAIRPRPERIGRGVGLLYGVNTLGAFAGVLCAGYLLLPTLGFSRSIQAAGALYGLVAFAGLLLSLFDRPVPATPPSPKPEPLDPRKLTPRPFGILTAFLFFSGFTAMVVQVCSARLFSMLLGSSVYSFSITLSVILAGIAFGSLIYAAWLAPRVEPYRILALAQGVLLVALSVGTRFADRLPSALLAYFQKGDATPLHTFALQAALVSAVLAIPALAMGVSFPAAMAILSNHRPQKIGREVGRALFVNTLGSIFGSFFTVFVLIPALGIQISLYWSAGLAGLWCALFTVIRNGAILRQRARYVLPIGVVVLFLPQLMPVWDQARLTSGMFRPGLARKVENNRELAHPAILYYREGITATVSVERLGPTYIMRINGKPEASNRADMPTQILVGALPWLLHGAERDQSAALIGYGSGVTAAALLSAPVKELTCVEIEPAVVEAARHFEIENLGVRQDPRLSVVLGDARTEIGYADRRYDLIVSEPSNPWISGAASLFTDDFYRMVRSRLTEGGVFGQWVQLYEISPESVRSLIRTFKENFPYVLGFITSERSVDLVLLGSGQPWSLDLSLIEKKGEIPSVKKILKTAYVSGGLGALALAALVDPDVEVLSEGGAPNTDDNGRIEFRTPLEMLHPGQYDTDVMAFHFDQERGNILPLIKTPLSPDSAWAKSLTNLAVELLMQGRTDHAYDLAVASLPISPSEMAKEIKEIAEMIYQTPEEWPPLPDAFLVTEKDGEDYVSLAAGLKLATPSVALQLAVKLIKQDDDPRLKLIAGVLALKANRFETAQSILLPLAEDIKFREDYPVVDYFLGRALDRRMRFTRAVFHLARYNSARHARQEILFDERESLGEIQIDLDSGEETETP